VSEAPTEPSLNDSASTTTEEINQRQKRKKLEDELWTKTGFQRPLGGFWNNYIYNLVTMVFGLVFMGVIFPRFILPFPEAMGFRSVVSSLFSLLFTIFDVGIGSSVTRFVAEQVGRGNIKKSLEYLRFFIWFQMITGLIQITIIAWYALGFAVHAVDFAPLVWFFLINSTVQYPGMLGVFKSGLQAFQRFDKSNLISILQTVIFEMTTQIAFILIGRYWGSQIPEMGELMGATMGYIIGGYIDDFIAMLLSAHFFQGVLKPYHVNVWDCLIPHFGKDVVKESTIFGLKNMAQGVFYQFSMLWITAITMIWLPNYATIIGLFSIADTVARILIQDLPMTAGISEAYNCGKKKLTDYYIQAQLKWYGILTPFLALEISMLVPPIFALIAENYAVAAKMIPWLVICRYMIGPIHFSDGVQQGCNKPEYAAYSLFIQLLFRLIGFWALLAPNALPALIPNYNYLIAYCMADLPAILAKNVFAWWLIDRKLIKVRVNVWQTFITPMLAVMPLIPINLGMLSIMDLVSDELIIVLALALVFIFFILFGAPMFIMFPILGLLGGWDDRGLQHLADAAELSGPSKPFVRIMYRASKWGFDHAPPFLKNIALKHPIPWEEADREAQELMDARCIESKYDTSLPYK